METQNIVNLLNDSNYSDGHILVTGNINVTGGDANTKVAFKNLHHLKNVGQK